MSGRLRRRLGFWLVKPELRAEWQKALVAAETNVDREADWAAYFALNRLIRKLRR